MFPAMFCNNKCLSEGWKRFHYAECRYLDLHYTDNTDIRETIVSLSRIFLQSMEIAKSVNQLGDMMDHSESKTIFDLDFRQMDDEGSMDLSLLSIVNSLQPRSDEMAKMFYESIVSRFMTETQGDTSKIRQFLRTQSDKETAISYASRLLMIFDGNSNAIQTGLVDEGCGIQLFGSLINHSCDPNIQAVFHDNKVAFVVRRPIGKKEQLFIQYR